MPSFVSQFLEENISFLCNNCCEHVLLSLIFLSETVLFSSLHLPFDLWLWGKNCFQLQAFSSLSLSGHMISRSARTSSFSLLQTVIHGVFSFRFSRFHIYTGRERCRHVSCARFLPLHLSILQQEKSPATASREGTTVAVTRRQPAVPLVWLKAECRIWKINFLPSNNFYVLIVSPINEFPLELGNNSFSPKSDSE